MAAITASMVAELRGKTDAPMMECKKALTEADGDMAKAEEILRVKLGNKATKAAARVAAEGVVGMYMSGDGKIGAMVEVNSETDFVAKNDEFIALSKGCAELVKFIYGRKNGVKVIWRGLVGRRDDETKACVKSLEST